MSNGFRDSLLEIWRETCRNEGFHDAFKKIVQLASVHLPLSQIAVRKLDKDRKLTTIAAWDHTAADDSPPLATLPSHLDSSRSFDAHRWKLVTDWSLEGELLHGDSSLLASLIPDQFVGDVFAIPLLSGKNSLGVLVAVSKSQSKFQTEDLAKAVTLSEPLSAALLYHQRAHELLQLREKFETDRRSMQLRTGKSDAKESIVGSDAGLRLVMERVELVSKSDVPVLILGETGTGKEVVARAIHVRSKRAEGPFIRVNCGAIPSELIDSQLFGHEQGSFTGASEQHQGWFERADGGTLFLDEIGELPLAAQVRMLRVLQDHQIERIGGKQPIHVDVRIVAATHRDLSKMVKGREFREDLWYRINVFPILLPQLRCRSEDIPELVSHFIEKASQRFGLPKVEASSSDLGLLINYPWPGNIRELAAVIDRAVILGDGKTLEVGKAMGLNQPSTYEPPISDEPTYYEVIPEGNFAAPSDGNRQGAQDILSLDDAMKQHIERAVAMTHGKIEGRQGAAERLGINPHTLRARMRKLGIDWSRFRAGEAQ